MKDIDPNRRIRRDRVISIVDGKDLVGVYYEDTDGNEVLAELSPTKADRLIRDHNTDIDERAHE